MYRTTGDVPAGSAAAVDLLLDRLADYRARVHRSDADALPAALADVLGYAGTVVVPPGLPPAWPAALTAAGLPVATDTADAPLSNGTLDRAGAVLTAARGVSAETGTSSTAPRTRAGAPSPWCPTATSAWCTGRRSSSPCRRPWRSSASTRPGR